MNCPHHHQIYMWKPRSYRDLPLRMFEFGLVSGFGIVVTMFAVILTLPVLLVIRERVLGKINRTIEPRDISYKFLGSIAESFSRKWIFTAIFVVLISVF